MNKPNRSIKFVLTAGVLMGFLPVLFGAPNSKAVAPLMEVKAESVKQVSVPRSAFGEEDRMISIANQQPEAPPVPIIVYEEAYGQCAPWMHAALSVGWPADQWSIVDRVMHRESRCTNTAFNDTDPNGGSWGLMQINGFWCKPNRWTEQGFLQDHGVLNSCDELFDPYVNLSAALAIWQYGEDQHGCGWKAPWLISCKK
jgi:hypothetical protein